MGPPCQAAGPNIGHIRTAGQSRPDVARLTDHGMPWWWHASRGGFLRPRREPPRYPPPRRRSDGARRAAPGRSSAGADDGPVDARRAGVHRAPSTARRVLRRHPHRLRPCAAPAGTPFQLAVWRALGAVPYGATVTYADVAGRIGRPRAVRAVGAANGRNPLSIVVPCHRVIGTDGDLTGYGWGVERKRWLLDHEQVRRD